MGFVPLSQADIMFGKILQEDSSQSKSTSTGMAKKGICKLVLVDLDLDYMIHQFILNRQQIGTALANWVGESKKMFKTVYSF